MGIRTRSDSDSFTILANWSDFLPVLPLEPLLERLSFFAPKSAKLWELTFP